MSIAAMHSNMHLLVPFAAPLAMNLTATCSPVLLSRASCTKLWEPLPMVRIFSNRGLSRSGSLVQFDMAPALAQRPGPLSLLLLLFGLGQCAARRYRPLLCTANPV